MSKIASAMIVDNFYQRLQKEKNIPLSTGMSTLKDIENAVNLFREHE